MKLFLTSVRTCVEYIPEFKRLLNRNTKLIVLPISYHKDYINSAEDVINHFDRDPLNTDSIFYETVRPFIDAGIDANNIVVLNPWADTLAYMEYRIMKEDSIIYLPGGYPEIIVEHVNNFGLLKAIKKAKVIVGESAGSMAISKHFFVYKDNDYKEYQTFKGLGLKANIAIIPHYTKNNKDIKFACNKFSRRHLCTSIYRIEDGGYVIIDNRRVIKTFKTYKL